MADTNKVVPLKKVEKPTQNKTGTKTAKKKPTRSKPTAKKPAIKKAASNKTPKVAKVTKAKAKVSKPAARPKKAAAKTKTSSTRYTQPNVQTKKTESVKPKTKPNPMEAFMTQGPFQFDQFTQEAANLNREGLDAFVKSGTIFAQGFEQIIRESMSFAQNSAEKQMQLFKEAISSKTINEFSDAQNKLAQVSFDDFMSNVTKISEISTKVLSEAVEPLNDQMAKSMQKATQAAAE